MPAQPTQSLDDLRSQARLTYRYWPIYLMMRLREIEQHLDPATRPVLASLAVPAGLDIAKLVTYGLWDSDIPLPQYTPPPPLALPAATRLRIQTRLQADSVLLEALAEDVDGYWQLPLLRSPLAQQADLQQVAAQFQAMGHEYPDTVILEAARLWAALHGARPLHWSVDRHPFNATAPVIPQPALPPRKRGRGAFRESR